MTYDLSLQSYGLPEWYQEAPEAWVTRLREFSPITENLSHLRFRYRAPHPHWLEPDRGQWELYSCTPRALATPSRAEQFTKHWSELPKAEQVGRRAMVSNYQHYMWHQFGVEARRCWVLQGENGGTTAVYTRREQRMLDAAGALSDPFPLGFFGACPFDERAVKAIVQRDRLVQAGNRFDTLEKMDRPAALKAEDELAERAFRETWLDWWYDTIQPQAEFMKSFLRTSEADNTLRKATRAEADAVSQWKEQYIEHGNVTAPAARSRALQIAVR